MPHGTSYSRRAEMDHNAVSGQNKALPPPPRTLTPANTSTSGITRLKLEFVEIWDRWLNDSLPVEVLGLLDHNEATLFPLYDNLLETFTRMHQELSEERRGWRRRRRHPPIQVHGPVFAANPFAARKSAS